MWTVSENYNRDLWVRLYDAQGAPAGAARPLAQTGNDEYLGALATRDANPFLAVWPTQIGPTTQLYGRLFGSGDAPRTTTFTPTNDAYISSAEPNTVFNSRRLNLKNATADYNPFLKFNVSGLSGTVQSARLRLWVINGGYDGGGVYAVLPFYRDTTTLWLETGLKWNNAPVITGAPLGHLGTNVQPNQWVEVDVTPVVLAALADNGRVSLAIWNGAPDVVVYSSKEGAHAPELVVITE